MELYTFGSNWLYEIEVLNLKYILMVSFVRLVLKSNANVFKVEDEALE
jgi:hypothetical protein